MDQRDGSVKLGDVLTLESLPGFLLIFSIYPIQVIILHIAILRRKSRLFLACVMSSTRWTRSLSG